MTAALLLLFVSIAASIGRWTTDRLGIVASSRSERIVYSTAVGLGIIGYVVLAVGMAGLLRPAPVGAIILVIAALTWRGAAALWSDIRQPWPSPRGVVAIGVLGTAVLAACVTIVNAYVPPGAHEWDALAYHLATPAVYILHGKIVFLPTDHHSNFPFLMEMWYLLGLLYQGPVLAALFHLATAALTATGLFAIGRRHFGAGAGAIAAVVFITVPIVLWEAATAYVEIAQTLLILTAIGACLEYRATRSTRWIALSGLLMGFALGVKTLSLVPCGIVLVLLAIERKPFRHLAVFACITLVVGCPFYVKTWALTGNPVYPFAYRYLGGKYWNQKMADAYQGEQKSFGIHHELPTAAADQQGAPLAFANPTVTDTLRNAILAPFALVAFPRLFYNASDPGTLNHLGFLFLSLPVLLAVAPRRPRGALWLAILCVTWLLTWTVQMQYVRYIVPMLGPLCLLAGAGASSVAAAWPRMRLMIGAVVLVQVAMTFGVLLPDLPERLAIATDTEARHVYLTHSVNSYISMEWLNRNTKPNEGVILYEETRGFYLQRPYLWGNAGHSLYIPYSDFQTGRQMAEWFVRRGYRYGLVNLRFTDMATTANGNAALRNAVASGTVTDLFAQWYNQSGRAGDHVRALLSDALSTGAAVILPDASYRDVVVLKFQPTGLSSTGAEPVR